MLPTAALVVLAAASSLNPPTASSNRGPNPLAAPGPDPPDPPADPPPASVAMRRQAAYTRFTMLDETVTLRLPEELHYRLAAAAAATRRSLEEILLHALRIGSPPAWDDAPPEQ